MDRKEKQKKSKLIHWTSRIGTTFGMAGLAWLYLYWLNLDGGVFFLGALCGLTAYEFLLVSPVNVPMYRRILLAVLSFFVPYLMHRILSDPARSEETYLYFEIFLGIFILLTVLSLKFPSLLKTLARSLLFPVWGIALPLTALIFTAHYFMDLGRTSTQALLWVIVIILLIKATDIGALLIGSWLGKNKLAPKTSPAKTIEGAIGGVLVSIGTALVIYFAASIKLHTFGEASPAWYDILKVIVATGIISIAGILGDLFESSWKRHIEIKNSGSMLPGLGGMYDLTDSLILAAPVAFFLLKYWVITI